MTSENRVATVAARHRQLMAECPGSTWVHGRRPRNLSPTTGDARPARRPAQWQPWARRARALVRGPTAPPEFRRPCRRVRRDAVAVGEAFEDMWMKERHATLSP